MPANTIALPASTAADGLRTPLYQQVYLALRERIISGELEAGSLLAGEQEVAKALGVSRITVKRAFNELASRGLVHRQLAELASSASHFICVISKQPLAASTASGRLNRFDGG